MLPEVSSSITTDDATGEKGDILVQSGNYGWYTTKKEDIKKQKSTKTVGRMLNKARVVYVVPFNVIFIGFRQRKS